MTTVVREDRDQCAVLTLNRPDKLNALTNAMFIELREHVEALHDDRQVRCVVITGAGRSFCAGRDLGTVGTVTEFGPYFEAETIDRIEELPVPVIAKIRGHCFTGGLELALACDTVVADRDAQFADTHGVHDVTPIWGLTVRLPERVGRAMAQELMTTSKRISGVEAEDIGLAQYAVDADELDSFVDTMAAAIVANSRTTNRFVKACLNEFRRSSRGSALLLERSRYAESTLPLIHGSAKARDGG